MLTLTSTMTVDGVTAQEITDLLLDCDDSTYEAWWPGVHRQFHVVRRAAGDGHVGDRVWMDELVGSRRLRMAAEVVEAVPGKRIVWQLLPAGLRLPVRVALTVAPDGDAVALRHAVIAGWSGRGRVLDPLWRCYLSPAFARDMDRHARTEFARLPALVRTARSPRRPRTLDPARVASHELGKKKSG